MNVVTLVGNLTKDLERHQTNGGTVLAKGTIAVQRGYGDETDFINFTVWGKQAESCLSYIGKGSMIGIEGELHIDRHEDKYYTTVNARSVKFLKTKRNEATTANTDELIDDEYDYQFDFSKKEEIEEAKKSDLPF